MLRRCFPFTASRTSGTRQARWPAAFVARVCSPNSADSTCQDAWPRVCRHIQNPDVARVLDKIRRFHAVVKANGGTTVDLVQMAAGNIDTAAVGIIMTRLCRFCLQWSAAGVHSERHASHACDGQGWTTESLCCSAVKRTCSRAPA